MLTNDRLNVIRQYRKVCSEIIKDKLYLGGYYIASDIKILEEYGINHIINVSGDTCMNMFEDRIEYKTYFIQDNPQESIEGVLYDSIEWIEEKFNKNNGNNNNKILVHCQEGVSRSSSIIIGYLMWKEKRTFSDVSEYVRLCRSTSSPNIGFTYQLLLFQKNLDIYKGVKLEKADKKRCDSEKSDKNNSNSVLFLEKEYTISSTKLYFMLNNIPACLINWKNDADQQFYLDSGKIYMLRQTLLGKDCIDHRERIWIWIGRQARKEILRECIIGILRFCRQILFIEMGIKNSIELENMDIRVDLILGALKNESNLDIDNVTNVNSSIMVLKYFMENNESVDFINILFPNNQRGNVSNYCHSNNCDGGIELTLQRSFSSPSIRSISKLAVDLDFDEIINDESEENDSRLDSLVTVESSFSFSSLPSSSSSLNSNSFDVVYPLRDSSDNESDKEDCDGDFDLKYKDIQKTEVEFESRHISSHETLNTNTAGIKITDNIGVGFLIPGNNIKDGDSMIRSKITGNTNLVGTSSGGNTAKVFIPKLNISENKFLSLNSENEDSIDNSQSNKSHLNAITNDGNILLYRYPDYFSEKSESLRYFDSDDLLPESVCPLVINTKRYVGNSNLVGISTETENEFTIYLWLGSNTCFFRQAKEIIGDSNTLINKNIKDLILTYSNKNEYTGKNQEFGILDLILLFIDNLSFITLNNIKGVYFEFENQESSEFWDLFYLS
ncbi:hypothetical protein FG386_000607 [Cryptosporidium ryanae]|uniref:uncharacterized protein n=1 Tax=Cryptosporidium ryanae TaxID=515981 RepID=UPI00351A79B5|nr:hypothetical protein FG386_000607 [Cryptosporidium ryanae]